MRFISVLLLFGYLLFFLAHYFGCPNLRDAILMGMVVVWLVGRG